MEKLVSYKYKWVTYLSWCIEIVLNLFTCLIFCLRCYFILQKRMISWAQWSWTRMQLTLSSNYHPPTCCTCVWGLDCPASTDQSWVLEIGHINSPLWSTKSHRWYTKLYRYGYVFSMLCLMLFVSLEMWMHKCSMCFLIQKHLKIFFALVSWIVCPIFGDEMCFFFFVY